MGTPLQRLYDRFLSKVDEDLTEKESLIFAVVDSAISKAYKACVHSLSYTLTDEIIYDGYFNNVLDNDEIELISLWMLYEWKRRRKEKLEAQRRVIGINDFNRLPDKVAELKQLGISMKDLKDEINELSNNFNTYKYE